jgi:hypothetical protein
VGVEEGWGKLPNIVHGQGDGTDVWDNLEVGVVTCERRVRGER